MYFLLLKLLFYFPIRYDLYFPVKYNLIDNIMDPKTLSYIYAYTWCRELFIVACINRNFKYKLETVSENYENHIIIFYRT